MSDINNRIYSNFNSSIGSKIKKRIAGDDRFVVFRAHEDVLCAFVVLIGVY